MKQGKKPPYIPLTIAQILPLAVRYRQDASVEVGLEVYLPGCRFLYMRIKNVQTLAGQEPSEEFLTKETSYVPDYAAVGIAVKPPLYRVGCQHTSMGRVVEPCLGKILSGDRVRNIAGKAGISSPFRQRSRQKNS